MRIPDVPAVLRRPRAATVLAAAALFVALGGSSYGALALEPDSVGTRQLREGAVTSAKVRDHTLRQQDFRLGELPAGPAGPAGPTGPKGEPGPPGPSDAYLQTNELKLLPADAAGAVVAGLALPAGSYVITATAQPYNTATSWQRLGCHLTGPAGWLGQRVEAYQDIEGRRDLTAYRAGGTVSLIGSATFDAPSSVGLTCRDSTGAAGLGVADATLVATRVETLHY